MNAALVAFVRAYVEDGRKEAMWRTLAEIRALPQTRKGA